VVIDSLCPNLEKLNLHACRKIYPEGFRTLSRLTYLKELDISSNTLFAPNLLLAHLASFLKDLKVLDTSIYVSNRELHALSQFKKLEKLSFLISDSATRVGFASLAQISLF